VQVVCNVHDISKAPEIHDVCDVCDVLIDSEVHTSLKSVMTLTSVNSVMCMMSAMPIMFMMTITVCP
jgi:hypothetical protein